MHLSIKAYSEHGPQTSMLMFEFSNETGFIALKLIKPNFQINFQICNQSEMYLIQYIGKLNSNYKAALK